MPKFRDEGVEAMTIDAQPQAPVYILCLLVQQNTLIALQGRQASGMPMQGFLDRRREDDLIRHTGLPLGGLACRFFLSHLSGADLTSPRTPPSPVTVHGPGP
jgi:hypothetical protein